MQQNHGYQIAIPKRRGLLVRKDVEVDLILRRGSNCLSHSDKTQRSCCTFSPILNPKTKFKILGNKLKKAGMVYTTNVLKRSYAAYTMDGRQMAA